MGEPRANGAAAARGEGAFDSNANQLCASLAQAAPNQTHEAKAKRVPPTTVSRVW